MTAPFTLEVAPLRRLVDIIARKVVQRRNTIPIVSCIALDPAGEGVTLRATDLDIYATASLPIVDGAMTGGFAVSAHALADVLKKAKGGLVSLAYDGDFLTIMHGTSRTRLRASPSEEMPRKPVCMDRAHSFASDAKGFAADLARLAPFISTEEKRYYMRGIGVGVARGRMTLCATDGMTMSIIDRACPAGAEAMGDFIILDRAVHAVRDALKRQTGVVTVHLSGNVVMIDAGGLSIAVNRIDGDFPDMPKAAQMSLGDDALVPLPLPDIEPRLARSRVDAVHKAAPDGATWLRGYAGVLICDPADPDWYAVVALMEQPVYSKGFAVAGDTFEYQDDDGVWHVQPLAVNGAGQIDLSRDIVRSLCGPTAPVETVAEIAAQPEPKITAICQPPAPVGQAETDICQPEETLMNTAIDVRFTALEQMIGAIAATVGDLAGAVAQIAASGTVDALPAVEALKSPEIAPVDWVGSYLDLVDEPVRAADELAAATASVTASVDVEALTVERDALAARVERLERALSVMAAGRRRQAKRARSEQGRAVNALAVAQESNAALVDERKRADAAESTLAQMKPIMDMLDAMRPAAPVAPIVDDGFCKPARGKARFAAMVQ